jgi:hypothetical protein
METAEFSVKIDNSLIHFVLIYRPPPSNTHRVPISTFTDECSDYFGDVLRKYHNPIILGDFNIHTNKPDDADANSLLEIQQLFNLHQVIRFPTHRLGNTLDLVFHREESTVKAVDPSPGLCVSDHNIILFMLNVQKPTVKSTTITYRCLKAIDMDITQQMCVSLSQNLTQITNLDDAIDGYNKGLLKILDEVAPLRKKELQ